MSKQTLWDRILEAQKRIPDSEWGKMLPDSSVLHDVVSCHNEIRRLREENAELTKKLDESAKAVEQLRVCKEFKASHGLKIYQENNKLRDEILELKEQKNEAEIHRDIISDYMDVMRPFIQSQKKPFTYKE
jgi:cell division septum initiation protein DivIVA